MNAIEFDSVGKQYRLGLVGTGTLQHDLNRWFQTSILGKEDPYLKIGEVNDRSTKGHSDYVWALKDISFKVEQGDVVGIIGKNGAGKSTLLKLLSHITAPTTGHITYRYEITKKLDEIVDFAGIERYLDTPVKRFSSGMTVRLGFAVAAFLEPEILVVDEVLAVGDAEFQKKAIGKMKDVSQGGGRTVLFVSHNMAAIRGLCKNGVVLENGGLAFSGNVSDCLDYYMESCIPTLTNVKLSDMKRTNNNLAKDIFFTDIKILNKDDIEFIPRCGQYVKFRVFFDVNVVNSKVRLSLAIRNLFDNPILSFPTDLTCDVVELREGKLFADLIIERLPLTAGEYKIALDASNRGGCSDHLDFAAKLIVIDDDFYGKGRSIPPHLRGKTVLYNHTWQFS